jgi:hypothetical protein
MLSLGLFLSCTTAAEPTLPEEPTLLDEVQEEVYPLDGSLYPFFDGTPPSLSLRQAFPAPDSYQRMPVQTGSFAHWLRGIPVKAKSTEVRAFDGRLIAAPAEAVVPLDVGKGDIQQCADSILRLYAEYRWWRGDADSLAYHFTSGDSSSWIDWRNGERFRIRGSKVDRLRQAPSENSYEEFKRWLHHSFGYAGTRSLRLDAAPVEAADSLQPGDFFVSPGSPGHAILILDIAVAPGLPPVALLGQGFMPAQDFHVLRGVGSHVIDGWFLLPSDGESLRNPSWADMPRSGALRFPQ